jgi:serine/threonine-protein kinase RsbW
MHTLEVSYPQNIESLFAKIIETASLPKGVCRDDIFAIELSFAEAVSNALIHGNLRSPQKKVRIEFGYNDGVFEMIITDQGEGFNKSNIPDPTDQQNLAKDTGRGLLLMENYMDKVEYNKKGNQIRMSKKINTIS